MLLDFKNLILNKLNPKTDFEQNVLNFIQTWSSTMATVPVQTSGSTGAPKIFQIEKEKMKHSARMTCNFLDLKEGDVALICLPIDYISGKMMVVRSMIRSLKLLVSEPSTQPLKELDRTIDFCAMTPLQVENSLDKIHLIRKLIIGGAAVSQSLRSKIYDTLKEHKDTIIYETYGMSETLSHIALKQVFPMEEDYFTLFEGIIITTDSRGCLVINAPQLNSELLTTNDLAEIKNENQFRFLGRVDNVINSGGAKIYPEQLEALAKRSIDQEIVFLGVADDALGQKLIAVIEGDVNENIIKTVLDLDYEKKFHKPKEILFINEFPRTPNGKISRLELKKKIVI